MALLQLSKLQAWAVCTTVLLLTAVLFTSDARRPKRPLIRANEGEGVPDTYFVHIRRKVEFRKMQEFVRGLHERSSQGGMFRANVPSIVTRAAYGFPAGLSPQALEYVSMCDYYASANWWSS